MRIAAISDIHGNLGALRAVLDDIEELDPAVEVIICAGDLVGHGAHPNEVLDLIRDRKIHSVRGNYDEVVSGNRASSGADYTGEAEEALDLAAVRWTQAELTSENLEYLRNLSRDARLQISPTGRTAVTVRKTDEKVREMRRSFLLGSLFGSMGTSRPASGRRKIHVKRVLLVHGSPRDTVEYLYPSTARSIFQTIAEGAEAEVIIFGHTHRSFQQVVGGVAFIGVGSVGRPEGSPTAEYAVIEIAGPEIEVEYRSVSYDVEREARDIERSGLPFELAEKMRNDARESRGVSRGA